MKFTFLSIVFSVLFTLSGVSAQSLNVGSVRITDDSISTRSDRGSVIIDDNSVSTGSGSREKAMMDDSPYMENSSNCMVNGKEIPCDQMGEAMSASIEDMGIFILIPIFFALLGLALCILWLYTLIHALTKPIENKIVWVIVIVFVPFGFLLYYFIEMKNFNKKMMAAYKSQNPVAPTQPEIK